MTRLVHLDTHVVAWLAAGDFQRFPPKLRDAFNSGVLRVSPMVRLELEMLHDKGRINAGADRILDSLGESLGVAEDAQPFADVISEATKPSHRWPNRDPFDRIIMASAIRSGALLATKDGLLREHFPNNTIWE